MVFEPMGNGKENSKHRPDARYQSFLITEPQHRELKALAKRNHRSISAEIRIAIDARLAAEELAA